jgi:hypothetical protein
MTYGHSTRLSAENAAVQRALTRASGTWGGNQTWRELDADSRLALIDEVLRADNDFIDDLPVAL